MILYHHRADPIVFSRVGAGRYCNSLILNTSNIQNPPTPTLGRDAYASNADRPRHVILSRMFLDSLGELENKQPSYTGAQSRRSCADPTALCSWTAFSPAAVTDNIQKQAHFNNISDNLAGRFSRRSIVTYYKSGSYSRAW